jgi:hypothetical protein
MEISLLKPTGVSEGRNPYIGQVGEGDEIRIGAYNCNFNQTQ